MKTKKYLILAWLLFISYILMAAPPLEEGKTIFMTRCAACHNVNKNLIGPALNGLEKKRSMDWIINFIRSSQAMIKNGDKDAIAVFEQHNKIPMPDHPDLTDENIKNIVEFINSESKDLTAVTPFIPGKKKTLYVPLKVNDYGFFTGFFIAVAMLVMVLFFAVQAKTYERNMRDKSVPS